MANHIVQITEILERTHNVRSYRVTKPPGFSFTPGQATDLSLQKKGWENEKRPFTFTSLPSDNYLEFTIKTYNDHDGVTHHLGMANPGDRFEISDAWGAIEYKDEGVFIAGGAGVTPFISIFRFLRAEKKISGNKLFFSNKTDRDIILRDEFENMLGKNFFNIITEQADTKYFKGRIDKNFLQKNVNDFKQHFYVCGPDAFNTAILKSLEELGAKADTLVFEK
ncbi:MAG: flavodoxin reductase [Bacteroidetes bacterium]|nr:flavodoxin reductase [Bacteroidota bacterium]